MKKTSSFEFSDEESKKLNEMMGSGSKMAVGALLNRYFESQRSEEDRICYDPYAAQFANQKILEWYSSNPERIRAMRELSERLVPGLSSSIAARCSYFDDFIKSFLGKGLEQLVILGAGYDSRAYRIEGLKRIKVFEVDHPAAQNIKIEKVEGIFSALPDHITYVSLDFAKEDIGLKMPGAGYDRSKKTLFVMEGLLYYLPPSAVDGILSFIAKNSGKGSAILFDYFLQSVVDRSTDLELGRNIHDGLAQTGEPLQFGIDEKMIEDFLTKRGFSQVINVTGRDYRNACFHGINKSRTVCDLLLFAHAVVE